MKTILLTNHYAEAPYRIVQSLLPTGFRFAMPSENSQRALMEAAPEADYFLASGRLRIDKAVLDRAGKLKMIQRTGVGLDSLELSEIHRRGIPLYVIPGVNAQSVAEHTLLLILACLRRLPIVHQNTKCGVWKKQEQGIQTNELGGKTVGLIGMGNTGRRVARLLGAFGAITLYYSHHRLSVELEEALGIVYKDFDALISQADILSLHCPLTNSTAGLIDQYALNAMKPGVIIVNTARGGLINTNDLMEAIRSGRVSFAGMDVYEDEPLQGDHPITRFENVILTPHIGGITYESFYRMQSGAMKNIESFEKGDLQKISQYLYKTEGLE